MESLAGAMGGTSITVSLKFVLLPIAKVLIICALGFLLASRRLSPSENKLLKELVFALFLPCLIFNQLLQWWFIPIESLAGAMGGTSITVSLKFVLLPIAEVLIIYALGFLLASHCLDILSPTETKLLKELVFTLFLPCLIFTQLLQWWFIHVNVVLAAMIGCIIVASIVVLIVNPPEELKKFILVVIGIDFKRLQRLPYTGLKRMKVCREYPADMPDAVEVDIHECGCCCADVPFQEMVQCADGHLFCFTCLRRNVEETTFGSFPASGLLSCIDMAGCDKSIPWSEIKRAIQAELLLQFEQRRASDCVARAKLQGLVYCPFCNFACEVDKGIYVLKCPEKSCLKESCVKCKEPSHLPLRCQEVEKPSDTNHRNQIEEIMTKSVLRQCTACKAELMKEDGCNRVTCRCGHSICYMCRKSITDYKHFCRHLRKPGKKCTVCSNCSLWDQEDAGAVALNAKRAALKTRAKKDASILARDIGPAEALFAKKTKR